MKSKAIIVSGYFNPLHRGHIDLFHNAKSNGDMLIVIVNNDFQRELKGSKEFMLEDERVLIVSQIKIVDEVFLSIDKDRTVRNLFRKFIIFIKTSLNFTLPTEVIKTIMFVLNWNYVKNLGLNLLMGLEIKFNPLHGYLRNKMKIKNICCIGAGYVGGPTMAVIALKCPDINVIVVDNNPVKIDSWNGPLENLPVYEPGLADIIKEVRGKNLTFSNDIKSSIERSR